MPYEHPADRAKRIPSDKLREIHELHDSRDTKTNIIAREKDLSTGIVEFFSDELPPIPEAGEKGGGINIGVARITRRRGRETVDIALLRDKLGEDAEMFITYYAPSTVITHIDPYAIENELMRRGEKM